MILEKELKNYERALSTKQYTLYVKDSISTLKLRLQVRHKNYEMSVYEAVINNLSDYQKLAELCDSFTDLKEYLKKEQNIKVDLKQQRLIVTQMSSFKINKVIELAEIKFDHISTSKMELSEIISQKCSYKAELKSDEIKDMLELLAFTLEELIISHRKDKIFGSQDQEIFVTKKQLNKQLATISKQLYIPSQKQMANGQILVSMIEEQRQKSLKESVIHINKQILQIKDKLQQCDKKLFSRTDIDVQVISEEINKFRESIYADCIAKAQKIINDKIFENQFKPKNLPVKFEESSPLKQMLKSSSQVKFSLNQPKTNWIDQTCNHFSRLIINKKTVTLNKQDAHVFGQRRISKYPTFSVYIQRMQKIIGLGIIDASYKSRTSMGSPPNALVYYKDGCYNGKQRKFHEGSGFKQKQIVTIVVEKSKGRIIWKVQDSIRYELQNQSIKDEKIEWVPYLYLMDRDIVVMND